MHEAQAHTKNSFLTLTYSEATLNRRAGISSAEAAAADSRHAARSKRDDASLDDTHVRSRTYEDSLVPQDVQQFMKSLRTHLTRRNPSTRIRFYAVGEYGEQTHRPHYHIALFGEDFSGDRTFRRTSGDYQCFESPTLNRLWQHGRHEIGELTTDSAAYIARYVMKKVNGKKADEHYRRETPDGEVYYLYPEFSHMSRRPGIGRDWLEEFRDDVYPHDHVIVNGHKFKPPRYYDKLMEAFDPTAMTAIKFNREMRCKELEADNTPERLASKEIVTKAKLAFKKRNLE